MADVVEGDCVEQMQQLDADSIDAIVTDPPYGIGFMGHDWDQPGDHAATRGNGEPGLDERVTSSQRRQRQPSPATGAGHPREREAAKFRGPTGKDNRTHTLRGGAMHAGRYDLSPAANRRFQAWVEVWASEALRVLKPGGHLVSFGSPRTYHRLAAGIEDAGFEIRDSVLWLFGQGFPKNRDLGDGWGTALKPAHEPIAVARKPFRGPVAANHAAHGTGGINVEGCGIEIPEADRAAYERNHSGDRGHDGTRPPEARAGTDMRMGGGSAAKARHPANVVLDDVAAEALDEQTGTLQSKGGPLITRRSDQSRNAFNPFPGQTDVDTGRGPSSGGPSRFYYCAKTSRSEREAGLDALAEGPLEWSAGDQSPGTFQSEGTKKSARNHHPTVKPIDLMRWLVRLVTPAGGLVLDPFAGSGTTGCAAALEGIRFLGIERDAAYVAIADARIAHWADVAARAAAQLTLGGDVA